MSVVAAAVVGTSVVGGLVSMNAANKAASSQGHAADVSNAESAREYDQTRADNQPWHDAGATALGQLGALTKDGGALNRKFTINDFIKDPGYDFRMQEGSKAIQRSAAARGGVLGGGTLKALTQYNQDYASNEYNSAFSRWNGENNQQFSRLSAIAGLGQNANAANQQAGQVNATNFSNNTMGAANASGAASIAGANALTNVANTGANMWMASKYFGK